MPTQAGEGPSMGPKGSRAANSGKPHTVKSNPGRFAAPLFGDVYSPKPESPYDGFGVAHVSAVQNLTYVRAMDAMTVCKCRLAPLTFKRRFQ